MAGDDSEKLGEIRIGDRLSQVEDAMNARSDKPIAAREICRLVRTKYGVPMSPSTYSLLKSNRRSPTVAQLIALARVFDVTPEFLVGELRPQGGDGIHWSRRVPSLPREKNNWCRALDAFLSGVPMSEALCRECDVEYGDLSDPEQRHHAEWELGRLAQTAVFMGVSALDVTHAAVNGDLSDQLRAFLVDDPKLPDHLKKRLQVTVIRNPAHIDWSNGGHIGPLLVGNYALKMIGDFLVRHAHANQLGLAGGFHVASLIRQVGIGELPWPERPYRLFPLTIEPFARQISLGDVLVGGLKYRLGALMGPERVQAYSLRAFGYLTDDGDVTLRQRSITTVLDQLTEIDVAVLGVGDSLTPDGPLQRVLATQGYKLASPEAAVADVCLNPINEDGELLPLKPHPTPGTSHISQLIGIDTEQLRRMSQIEKNKLVLLLATGAKKATSTQAIVRGGFVNHVLCDDQLARELLA